MRTKCWVESKRDLACPMMEGDERVSPARQAIHNRRAIHVPQCRAAKSECPRMARMTANRKPLAPFASFAGKQCRRKLRTADASSRPERSRPPGPSGEVTIKQSFSRARVDRLVRRGNELRANTTPNVGRFYPSPPDDANNRGPVGFSHKKHEKSQKGCAQFLWLFVFFVAIICDSFRRLPSRRVLSERHSC